MEALFHKLQEDLTLAERQRCNAVAERDELADQIRISKQCMLDEKRRLEVRISELEDELEEEHTNLELANDKARKSMITMEQMASDLAAECSVSQKLENQRLALERQNKDMREKLRELEGQNQTRTKATKATITALEGTIANLEDQLKQKAKEMAVLARKNRKMDTRLKEVHQAEDECRSAGQYREQLLKKRADEAEEEVASINAEKRKVQRDLDDQMEQNGVLVRELQSLRKYRPSAQAKGEDDSSEDGQEEQ